MNKLTKLLSVFIIAGAVGAGVVGVTGCNSGNSHKHSYSYTDNQDGTHTATCSKGDSTITDQAHVDAKNNEDGSKVPDGLCDLCGATMPSVTGITVSGEKSVGIGFSITLEANVAVDSGAPKTVKWSSSDTSKATVNADTGEVTGVALGEVTITATSTYDNSVKGEYQITVREATDYEKLMAREDRLITITGETGDKMPVYSNSVTPGVYGKNDSGGDPATDYVQVAVEDGTKVLKQVAIGKDAGGKNISTDIIFGPVSGEVEGVFTTKISKLTATTSNQTPIKLIDYDGNSVFRLVTTAGDIVYSGEGITDTAVSAVKLVADQYITFYFKINLDTGKLTVKLNDTVVADNISTTINALSGIELSSSNSGDRLQTTKNFVVCGAEASLTQYVANRKSKLDDIYKNYNAEDYTINYSRLTAAYNAGVEALTATSITTVAGATAAYTEAVSAMADVLSDAAISSAQQEACAQLEAQYPATNYTITGLTADSASGYDDSQYNNKSAYESAIAAAKAEINAQQNRDAIAAAVEKHKAILSAIKTDAQAIDAKRAEAQNRINIYLADEIAELDGGEFNATYEQIIRAKEEMLSELLTYDTVPTINEKLALLKGRIDDLYATTQMTLEQTQEANTAALNAYVETVLDGFLASDSDDSEVIAAINQAKQDGLAAIAAADSRGNANAELFNAREMIAFIVSRGKAVQEIKLYADGLKRDYYLDTAKALFDEECAAQIVAIKSITTPDKGDDAAFADANADIAAKIISAKSALDGKKSAATDLELAARETWSGTATLDLNQSYDFTSSSIAAQDKMNKASFAEKYNLDWLGVAEENTGRVRQQAGYFDLYAEGSNAMNTIMTVTTKSAGAQLTITFQSVNTNRYFIIKDAGGNIVGEGAATTAGLPTGAYEQKSISGVPITLGAAGTYKVYFCTSDSSTKEHKISSISLIDKEVKDLTGAVNSLTATGSGASMVVTAEIEMSDGNTTNVTLAASEYTVVGNTVIYGTGKTAEDANKYNSCTVA